MKSKIFSTDLLLEFLDGSLSKLGSSLSLLQLGGQGLDLLLVAGLSLISFVLGDLEGLEVGGDDSQLFLQLDDLQLSGLCPLLSSLKLGLNLLESLLDLVVLLDGLLSLVPGVLQFLLQLSHPLLILDGSVLKDLPHSVRVISSSSSLVQLVGSNKKFVLAGLEITLKTLDSSVERVNLQLG